LAKTIQIKPEEAQARAYADRLILHKLTELQSVVKLSEIADDLNKSHGIGLSTVRALLASNTDKFAYAERRWVPASRISGEGRPFAEVVRLVVDHFGGPMPIELLVREVALLRHMDEEAVEELLLRLAHSDNQIFLTEMKDVAIASWVFVASGESRTRAFALNGVSEAEVEELKNKLGKDFDWRAAGAATAALKKLGSANIRTLGAVAWSSVNSEDPKSSLVFEWKKFAAELLSVEGFVFGPDGSLAPEADAKKWINLAVKLAERLAPSVEIEDAAPIEVKGDDIDRMVQKILDSGETVTATRLLEEFYEITPSVKTFPDDLSNIMTGLNKSGKVWWVGGDRYRKPNSAPDFIESVPELFQFPATSNLDEENEYVDCEINDDGLSSTLRKLLNHPLALDVLDEEPTVAPKQQPESIRLVLKSIHRELGTFPLSQMPAQWLDAEPHIQEVLLQDNQGRELQAWVNTEARLMFGLIDWFFDQPVESGAVFSLTKTSKPNVLDFEWLDQTDPVVFISSQRMEELRNVAAEAEGKSTLELLQTVMSHWPKGADFLTILWELNVVRRTSRRMVASLLTTYQCFYQRSGSPVWHYDAKKNELGFDKTKKKFIIKR